MKKEAQKKILVFVICLILVYLTAALGSLFTTSAVNSNWYEQSKPQITPPNFVFPIVWNILFLLIAISLYLAFTNSRTKKQKTNIAILFGINLILNALWSYLFFKLKNPKASFIELIFLWLSILSLIIYTYRINKKSSYLLWPYFLWVSFAAILNFLWI